MAQIRATYRMAAQVDRRLGLWTFGTGAAVALLMGLLAWLVGPWGLWVVIGLPMVLLAMIIVFGRRVERAAYVQLEGKPGAAMSAMSLIRRGWTTTPAIAVNRQQDVVHRAVGRAGIVLIGEGDPGRVRALLGTERKRHARIAADVPITEIVIGNDEGQVPLRKLARTLRKLPKQLQPAQVTDLTARLRAMPTQTQQLPIPKGPLPKNVKLPKGMPKGGLPR
jgi:hypothetical protein